MALAQTGIEAGICSPEGCHVRQKVSEGGRNKVFSLCASNYFALFVFEGCNPKDRQSASFDSDMQIAMDASMIHLGTQVTAISELDDID